MFDWKFLLVFIGLSLFNVIFSTVRPLLTINGGKTTASLVSGAYYAFYNVMLIYTVADFPMWQKCVITFICNVIGVFVVKWAEEKARKDKLWKVEATISNDGIDPSCDDCIIDLKNSGIPMNYIDVNKYIIINCYCATQADSAKVRNILNQYNAKYFVSESKNL